MLNRNRVLYFFMIIIVICLGLFSRISSDSLPAFVAEYSGDTLWALMVFFILGFIFVRYSTIQIAILSSAFSYLIELSQLYQTGWINSLRGTRIGGLVLGYGFLWSDLICYAAGIFFGICLEKLFQLKSRI